MKTRFPFTLNRSSPQATGLQFWGPGGHGSGNLFDLTGNGQNGDTINGTIPAIGRWTEGVDGGGKTALTYDGGTNRTTLANSGVYFGSNRDAISLCCWVKTSNIANYNYLMVNWGTAVGSDSWHLRLDQTTGFVYFTHSSTGAYTPANDVNGTINCADGAWHHIVATHDNTTTNTSIYHNGKLDVSASSGGNMIGLPTSIVSFGGLSDGNVTANWLLGTMDDPRIYNYAVPANLVMEMYAPSTRWQLRKRPRLFAAMQSGNAPELNVPPLNQWPQPRRVPRKAVAY